MTQHSIVVQGIPDTTGKWTTSIYTPSPATSVVVEYLSVYVDGTSTADGTITVNASFHNCPLATFSSYTISGPVGLRLVLPAPPSGDITFTLRDAIGNNVTTFVGSIAVTLTFHW